MDAETQREAAVVQSPCWGSGYHRGSGTRPGVNKLLSAARSALPQQNANSAILDHALVVVDAVGTNKDSRRFHL